MDDVLRNIEQDAIDEAREKVNRGEDKGYVRLLADLSALYIEAENFHFHDFLNTKYATPKAILAEKLNSIRELVINGEYDN